MSQEETFIDVTSYRCPFSFVKIKTILEDVEGGTMIRVVLRGQDSLQSIRASLEGEGHRIVSCHNHQEEDIFDILFLK